MNELLMNVLHAVDVVVVVDVAANRHEASSSSHGSTNMCLSMWMYSLMCWSKWLRTEIRTMRKPLQNKHVDVVDGVVVVVVVEVVV